ncbi:MAG TPA: hypothetical protein PLI13_00910 [Paracoccus sp. (in: a-proteobacteria)]|nr:hypothetical protein [Paracoccus sp. (in: a-proteobacteria)]
MSSHAMGRPGDDLRKVIADVRERTEGVYIAADEHSGGDHHLRWDAIRKGEALLAEYLRNTYDARISEEAWTNTICMCGIRSSATAGLLSAFRNWAVAAERRADQS